MQSNTFPATSAAVTFPDETAFSVAAAAALWLAVGSAAGNSAGRFLSDVEMPVGTNAGHNTVTPIFAPATRRS